MIEILLTVDGMMCEMCEAHVTDAVRNNFKVKSVSASHKSGECRVVCDENTDREKLVSVIEAQGYKVLGLIEKSYEKKGIFAKLFNK